MNRRPSVCCGVCPETVSGRVDCTCRDNPRCDGPICRCGHPALLHHGEDGRPRRDAGCLKSTMHDDWCRCALTAEQVLAARAAGTTGAGDES